MKKKAKLVLAKETLRVLTQRQASAVDGGLPRLTLDPQCFYSEASCVSVMNCC